MTVTTHPLAPHHLPAFITPPGETDTLLWIVGIGLVLALVALGVGYLTLHSLPERVAHRRHRLQLELVAVLGLLSLFTHNNLFWVAALVLALVDLPDVLSPLRRLADAAERMVEPRGAARPDASAERTEG